MQVHFIKSGEWTVIHTKGIIRTDLGSCVALCLWDPVRKLGGLNHYLLPNQEMARVSQLYTGSFSNKTLIEEMLKAGASLSRMRAGVVGGGLLNDSYDPFKIGIGNVAIAEKSLQGYNIPIVFKRTGGNFSRSVQLDVESGYVNIREIALGSGNITKKEYLLGASSFKIGSE